MKEIRFEKSGGGDSSGTLHAGYLVPADTTQQNVAKKLPELINGKKGYKPADIPDTDKFGVGIGNPLGLKNRETNEEYKYNVTVNLQPGPVMELKDGKFVNTGKTKDLNFIKENIASQINNFPLGDETTKIIAEVNACTTQEDIVACLNRHGIGFMKVS